MPPNLFQKVKKIFKKVLMPIFGPLTCILTLFPDFFELPQLRGGPGFFANFPHVRLLGGSDLVFFLKKDNLDTNCG
jgi:hypothetical protein